MIRPKKVRAKITRVVTEIATVYLDRGGCVDEYEECIEELDMEDIEVIEIRSVITSH